MTPAQAISEIDAILDACEPEIHSSEHFEVPLKKGTYAVSIKHPTGPWKGEELILIRDVGRRQALWAYLNILKRPSNCKPKFHSESYTKLEYSRVSESDNWSSLSGTVKQPMGFSGTQITRRAKE